MEIPHCGNVRGGESDDDEQDNSIGKFACVSFSFILPYEGDDVKSRPFLRFLAAFGALFQKKLEVLSSNSGSGQCLSGMGLSHVLNLKKNRGQIYWIRVNCSCSPFGYLMYNVAPCT